MRPPRLGTASPHSSVVVAARTPVAHPRIPKKATKRRRRLANIGRTESHRPRRPEYCNATSFPELESLTFCGVGEDIASPNTCGLGRHMCLLAGACVRALGQESLSTLSQHDRSAGRLIQRNVWQPRTELSEGTFHWRASHHRSPSRTAESARAPTAPSSSRSAYPGRGRGVSRLLGANPLGADQRHQLEDGVHYAEAPSSVVHQRVPTKERSYQ